jgi:hypothetical protein
MLKNQNNNHEKINEERNNIKRPGDLLSPHELQNAILFGDIETLKDCECKEFLLSDFQFQVIDDLPSHSSVKFLQLGISI